MFANERRKAKVLNFSIAYGKTAHGLSKDFKTSLKEAEETVNRWYADRPEVRPAWNICFPFAATCLQKTFKPLDMPLVDAATLRQFCCQLPAATAFRFACCPMQLALCSHDGGSAHTAVWRFCIMHR